MEDVVEAKSRRYEKEGSPLGDKSIYFFAVSLHSVKDGREILHERHRLPDELGYSVAFPGKMHDSLFERSVRSLQMWLCARKKKREVKESISYIMWHEEEKDITKTGRTEEE